MDFGTDPYQHSQSRPRWLRVLVALDILVNVLVLNGNPHETISQHAARAQVRGKRWGCVLCQWLNRLSRDHCLKNLTSSWPDADQPQNAELPQNRSTQ